MRIFFIRHPETLWNKKRLFQGMMESKISQTGYLETERFVEKTKKIKIDTIYYATNKRCEYLAKELLEIHTESKSEMDIRLNERSFGKYEGLPESEIAETTDFNPKDFMKKFTWRPPGGESLKDILPRVRNFLSDIKRIEKNSEVVFVITSGGVIRVALLVLGLKTLEEAMAYKAKNLEMVEIVFP